MSARQFWESALKGSQWLARQQDPDGGWTGLDNPRVDAFYKGGWAFFLTGQPVAAHRLLNYARTQFMTDAGDFLPRDHPWHSDVHYLYANAYFIVGSMVAGRYEMAMPAVDFLLSQQDTDHGGFFSRCTPPGQKQRCDTMSAGAAGMALLAAGRLDAARRTADFLGQMIQWQPEPETRFYTTVEADGTLDTTVADDEAFWRVIDTKANNQCWYAVGLPFAFLVCLAEATGQVRHRDLAQGFFDFQTRCVDPWDGGSSGKAGWGCAMLYRITGETRYRDIAFHVADRMAGQQQDDGNWTLRSIGYATADEEGLTNVDFDITAEFTLWLALIATNVLARDET